MQYASTMLAMALAAGTLYASDADAATIERTELRLATLACQPATAIADGAIRKRPLAVQNEGNANAFVTCASEGVFGALAYNKYQSIGLVNNGTANASVNCTLVDGRGGLENPVYFTKSASLLPGGTAQLSWTTADNGGANYIYPAISCNLPPDTGISYVGRRYDQEIGS